MAGHIFSNVFDSIDYSTFKKSTILMMLLFLPFGAIHEFGHLIPCWLNGYDGNMSVGLFVSQAYCSGLDDSLVFAYSGGFLACMFGLMPLASKKVNKHQFLIIALGSFGIGHFFNAVIEAFGRDWYMTSDMAVPAVTTLSFSIFVIMLLVFGKKQDIPNCKHPKKMRDKSPDGQQYCMNCNQDL